MFRSNQNCRIQLSSGNDVYGQPLPVTYRKERCAVVRLVLTSVKSTVRADSSATRGNARELQASSIILLAPTTRARINDILEIGAVKLRIEGIFARHDVLGRLDHYEINAAVWSTA